MDKYSNAYAEVYTILEYLDEEEKKKIPPQVLEAIEQSRNKEYIFDIEDDIELKDQILLPETRAILFNLFRDYLSEPWQKEKIIKMQREERERNEQKKKQMYNSDVFAKEDNSIENSKKESKNEKDELVVYNENIFKKIWGYIKRLFQHKNM